MRRIKSVRTMSAKEFGSHWAPSRLMADYGIGLTRMADSAEFDFRHDVSGARIELKAARAVSGVFIFQYIRPDCFDLCVCLGWENGNCQYWIIPASNLSPFLSKQHRSSGSFQLRMGTRSRPKLAKFAVAVSALRDRLDVMSLRVGRAQLVRLDSVLANVQGWPAVASSIARKMGECGFTDWSFVIKALAERVGDHPGMLAYPTFNDKERRIELSVYPEGVVGRHNVAATATSLLDFLVGHAGEDEEEAV
jgi:hypothetical protein